MELKLAFYLLLVELSIHIICCQIQLELQKKQIYYLNYPRALLKSKSESIKTNLSRNLDIFQGCQGTGQGKWGFTQNH